MKLQPKLRFVAFVAPELALDCGSGVIVFTDKENFGIRLDDELTVTYLIPCSTRYYMKLLF